MRLGQNLEILSLCLYLPGYLGSRWKTTNRPRNWKTNQRLDSGTTPSNRNRNRHRVASWQYSLAGIVDGIELSTFLRPRAATDINININNLQHSRNLAIHPIKPNSDLPFGELPFRPQSAQWFIPPKRTHTRQRKESGIPRKEKPETSKQPSNLKLVPDLLLPQLFSPSQSFWIFLPFCTISLCTIPHSIKNHSRYSLALLRGSRNKRKSNKQENLPCYLLLRVINISSSKHSAQQVSQWPPTETCETPLACIVSAIRSSV